MRLTRKLVLLLRRLDSDREYPDEDCHKQRGRKQKSFMLALLYGYSLIR